MAKIQISKEEYEEIKAYEKTVKDKKVSKRLQVLMLRYEGKTVEEIHEKLDLHVSSISKICSRYREQGLEEFARNKYTSHSWAMSYEEEEEILEAFREKAEQGHQITAMEIKAAFDEKRGKDTGRGYIYMLLERHGWRKVMPRSKHPKSADEEACEASKKLSPQYKNQSDKNPELPARSDLCSRMRQDSGESTSLRTAGAQKA